jgi:anti-anti-sigma factor
MLSGKILYAVHDGTYVIKLIGDVRMPMCASLDGFLDKMFSDAALTSVLVDLTETTGIDSTALGLIAKIAVFLRERFDRKPVLMSTNPDVNRVLNSMGFDSVFIILEYIPDNAALFDELPDQASSQQELTRKVIEAHRVLMGLNEQNQETFRSLVDALESEQRSQPVAR